MRRCLFCLLPLLVLALSVEVVSASFPAVSITPTELLALLGTDTTLEEAIADWRRMYKYHPTYPANLVIAGAFEDYKRKLPFRPFRYPTINGIQKYLKKKETPDRGLERMRLEFGLPPRPSINTQTLWTEISARMEGDTIEDSKRRLFHTPQGLEGLQEPGETIEQTIERIRAHYGLSPRSSFNDLSLQVLAMAMTERKKAFGFGETPIDEAPSTK